MWWSNSVDGPVSSVKILNLNPTSESYIPSVTYSICHAPSVHDVPPCFRVGSWQDWRVPSSGSGVSSGTWCRVSVSIHIAANTHGPLKALCIVCIQLQSHCTQRYI